MDSQRSGLKATDLSGPRIHRQGGLPGSVLLQPPGVWSWGRVSVEQEIRASPRGGPAGTGPLEQGPRAGAAPGGTACLSGWS